MLADHQSLKELEDQLEETSSSYALQSMQYMQSRCAGIHVLHNTNSTLKPQLAVIAVATGCASETSRDAFGAHSPPAC